jgi:poly(3-hydroxybutyrate) depolymerase
MTKRFYSYAVFFTALQFIVGLFHAIMYFRLGAALFDLPSVSNWFIFTWIISVIWSLILLKYYQAKQYRSTFRIMAISIVASAFQAIHFYDILRTREMTIYYMISILGVLIAGLAYGLILTFSNAGERPWLKRAGIFQIFVHLAFLASAIWALTSIGVSLNGTIEKIEQWASLVASIAPVFFMMNFVHERTTAKNEEPSLGKSLGALLDVAALVALASALIFVPKFAMESLGYGGVTDTVPQYVRKLAEPFEARSYVNFAGDTLRYRLMIPQDYDSAKKYPMVVCLHGSSGCGTDNIKQVATSWPAQLLSQARYRTKYPAFLFVPQCPARMGWGGIPGLPSVDSLVFETIVALQEEFDMDLTRCYVSGNSLGGYGTWHMISTRREIFAAAIPISGEGNPELASRLVDIPIWAFHGRKDKNVPVRGSQEIITAIKNAGGNPRYTEFPDEAHHIWEQVTNTPGLLDWLFSQKKK